MSQQQSYVAPHYDHGNSAARWVGVSISFIGFMVGGIAFPFHVWSLVYLGGALQVVAVAAAAAMNAAGFGASDRWNELKAQAAAERA